MWRIRIFLCQGISSSPWITPRSRIPLILIPSMRIACSVSAPYSDSELSGVFWLRVNPGLCKTELGRENDSWVITIMLAFLARTSEMGSRTLTHAAIGTDGENFKGEYLSDCKVDEYSPVSLPPISLSQFLTSGYPDPLLFLTALPWMQIPRSLIAGLILEWVPL